MKKTKRALSYLLAAAMAITSVCVPAGAEYDSGESSLTTEYGVEAAEQTAPVTADGTAEEEIVYNGDAVTSGECGEALTWSFDEEHRVLSIVGTGDMTNYSASSAAPWYVLREKIEKVVIGNGVTSIGNYAFYYCQALEQVDIPAAVKTVGSHAFDNAKGTELVIPDTVETVSSYAFQGCSFETLVLGNGVTDEKLGNYGSSITNFVIGDGIKEIKSDGYKFWGYSLVNVTIGSGVKTVEPQAFNGSWSGMYLRNFYVSDSNEYFRGVDGVLFTKDKSKLVKYPAGRTDDSYTVPDGVKTIGDRSFYGSRFLTEVTMPAGLETIEECAFLSAQNSTGGFLIPLKKAIIPDSVKTIGNNAFGSCASISEVYIGKGVTALGSGAFSSCTRLGSLTIAAEELTEIGKNAFTNCSSLTEVVLPDSVTSLGVNAFNGCTMLADIDLPEGLKKIESSAFYSCTSLTRLDLPEGLTSIGETAFGQCNSLRTLTIPSTVNSLGKNAFSSCTGLESVTIDSGVYMSGYGIFEGCTGLTDAVISDGVTLIGSGAFSGCTSLDNVSIGNDVKTVSSSAFSSCTSLKNIIIPESVTNIGSSAFYNCTSLKSLTVPDSVTSLGGSVFRGCTDLLSVIIGNSVNSIEANTFNGCTKLTKITLPESVKKIGDSAFYGCTALSETEILGNITDIGSSAFKNCISLEEFTIPKSVTRIGSNAFEGCSLISEIVIPDNVKTICDYAFINCGSLFDVLINDSVTYIGEKAFMGCPDLTDIYYTGSQAQWELINKQTNCISEDVAIHFDCVQETDISTLDFSDIPVQVYTGSAVKPEITVTDGNKTLENGKDYTLYYSNNINAGAASVTVTGMGDYIGTKTLDFEIKDGDSYPVVTAKGGDKSVVLSWNRVSGAEKYGVYRYDNGEYTSVALNVTAETYTVTGLDANKEYTFFVQAFTDGYPAVGRESYASAVTEGSQSSLTYPVLTAVGGDKQITLTWTAVSGATKYGVYSYDKTGNKYTKINLAVTDTTYTVTGLEDATEYTFFVQAYKDKWLAGADESYAAATTDSGLAYPILTAKGGDKSVVLTWTAVSGATKYGVYSYDKTGNKYTKINLAVTDTAYTVTGLEDGTEYSFFVQAYKDKWLAGGDESYATAATNSGLLYPVVTAAGGDKQITLTWTAVAGATKYGVYSYNKSTNKYTKIDLAVTGTTYTVTGLADSTEYTFFVQAYKAKWLAGGDESYATATTNGALPYPVLKAEGGKKQVVLTWTAVEGATKYGLYRYTASNNKYTKIDLTLTGTSYTVTGLADSTEYTFFVQAYKDKWLTGADASYATAKTD